MAHLPSRFLTHSRLRQPISPEVARKENEDILSNIHTEQKLTSHHIASAILHSQKLANAVSNAGAYAVFASRCVMGYGMGWDGMGCQRSLRSILLGWSSSDLFICGERLRLHRMFINNLTSPKNSTVPPSTK